MKTPLRSLEWITTYNCPGRCFYCYQEGINPPAMQEKVGAPELLTLLDEGNFQQLIVTGGEPQLLPGIIPLLKEIAKGGIRVNLLTRMEMSETQLEQLLPLSLFTLEIGIDTFSNSTATLIGCPTVSEKYLKLVGSISAKTTGNTVVRTVVTTHNLQKLRDLGNQVLATGIGRMHFIFPDYPQNTIAGKLLEDSAAEMTRFSQVVSELSRNGLKITIEKPHSKPQRKRPDIVCAARFGSLTLFPDGNIAICQHLPQFSLGSVFSKPMIDQQLLSSYTNPGREKFAGSECHNCELFEECNATGRCYYSAHKAGNVYGPDDYCPKGFQE